MFIQLPEEACSQIGKEHLKSRCNSKNDMAQKRFEASAYTQQHFYHYHTAVMSVHSLFPCKLVQD